MRAKGQVAKSQELNSALIFMVAAIFMLFYAARISHFVAEYTHQLWRELPTELDPRQAILIINETFWGVLKILLPFALTIMLTALLSNIFQVGWLVSTHPLKPDLSKMNPINGFKRFFSAQPYVQLLQTSVKITIFTWIAYTILKNHYADLHRTVHMELDETGRLMGSIVWEIAWKLGLAMLILAIIDTIWQRYNHQRSIRMSKKEIKDESKNAEGDPQIKSKIRQLQRKRAMQRMMDAIPKADVVLTNPVHLAVAIEYKKENMSAPVVLAKGAGQVAERIKALAREHDIMVLENKPLAQALFRSTEVGEEIPSDLYAAVSEVLVYVYQLTGKLESA